AHAKAAQAVIAESGARGRARPGRAHRAAHAGRRHGWFTLSIGRMARRRRSLWSLRLWLLAPMGASGACAGLPAPAFLAQGRRMHSGAERGSLPATETSSFAAMSPSRGELAQFCALVLDDTELLHQLLPIKELGPFIAQVLETGR